MDRINVASEYLKYRRRWGNVFLSKVYSYTEGVFRKEL